jgi:hypothetical protein
VSTERTHAGEQYIIPGAEHDAGASLARKRIAEPLRPAKPQAACNIGLFDTDTRNQGKLDL